MSTSSYLVMLYHRFPSAIYDPMWIRQCVHSIQKQTFQDFDVVELDYSGTGEQVYEGSDHWVLPMGSFVECTNYLLDYARDQGYKGAFNVHLDDFYDRTRFEHQVKALADHDLVSSNFYSVNEIGQITNHYYFDRHNIQLEMDRGHNVICNPVVAFSERWLNEAERFQPDECPVEDFECWKRNRDMKMIVLPEYLCYKRFHENEVSTSDNR